MAASRGRRLGLLVPLRLLPEVWLKDRPSPELLARTLPWAPIAMAGTLVAVLHFGAPSDVRVQYLIASVPAALTLLWCRTFYVPPFVGMATLALLRAL